MVYEIYSTLVFYATTVTAFISIGKVYFSVTLAMLTFMKWGAVRPDRAIYWTLGNFLKPLATINLPKFPTFLGDFFKVVKIYHFSSKIIFGQLL